MTTKKTGKLTYIAKTKGVKLDGEDKWYNPTEKCKAYVVDTLLNKTVELDLINEKDFSFIKESIPQFVDKNLDVVKSETSSLGIEFHETGTGYDLANYMNEFGSHHEVKASQTGYNEHNKSYYAFMWFKR